MGIKKRNLLKPLVALFLIFSSNLVRAEMITLTAALQNETFKSDTGEDVTRLSIGAIGAEYELMLVPKLSFGILGGAQVSLTEQESLSFGLGGFLNYYFKGTPKKSEFVSDTASFMGMSRWAYYVGMGVEERFLNSSAIDSEVHGGIFLRGGGRYIWNSKMYGTFNLKYFMAGAEFSSIDFVFGLGFYL